MFLDFLTGFLLMNAMPHLLFGLMRVRFSQRVRILMAGEPGLRSAERGCRRRPLCLATRTPATG